VGVEKLPIAWPIVVAAAAGLAISAALWWLYFDAASLAVEEELRRLTGAARTALARDAYSFFHLPLVAGIVVLAVGLKKTLEYVGDTDHHSLGEPLSGLILTALYGGVVLYLLGHLAFKWRALHRVTVERVVGVFVVAGAGLLVQDLRAIGQLLVLTALVVGLVAAESIRHAEERDEIRHGTR
jgi:low temperature requirement protein LtrA